MVNCKELE